MELKSTVTMASELLRNAVTTGAFKGVMQPFGIQPTGKSFSVRGATVAELEGDEIKHESTYYDGATFMQQQMKIINWVESLNNGFSLVIGEVTDETWLDGNLINRYLGDVVTMEAYPCVSMEDSLKLSTMLPFDQTPEEEHEEVADRTCKRRP